MSQPGRITIWKLIIMIAGIACLVIACPFLMLGMLGLVGVLADTSLAENRTFGIQFLLIGAVPGIAGTILVILTILGARRPS